MKNKIQGLKTILRGVIYTTLSLFFINSLNLLNQGKQWGARLVRHRGDRHQADLLEKWLWTIWVDYADRIIGFTIFATQVFGKVSSSLRSEPRKFKDFLQKQGMTKEIKAINSNDFDCSTHFIMLT